LFRDHGQPEPIADPAEGQAIAASYLEIDPGAALVAVSEGRISGAGFLHPRDGVASVGPVAVDPDRQGRGLGKLLIDRLLEQTGTAAVRVAIDAFNTRALGMAAKRGFVPVDQGMRMVALGRLAGPGMLMAIAPAPVRDLVTGDLAAVAAYDAGWFGGSRERDFRSLMAAGAPGLVAEENGKVIGFLFGRLEGSLATIGPGGADSSDLFGKLLARLGEGLAQQANIVLAHLPMSPVDGVRQAMGMGLRAASLTVTMMRGTHTRGSRAVALPLPPDVV
jgi:GNAT superfamily N-acetyltransferase